MRTLFKNTVELLPLTKKHFFQRFPNATAYGLAGYLCNIKIAKPLTKPIYAQIEPTTNCNLHCKMCKKSIEKQNSKQNDLAFDDFKKIIDSLPTVLHVSIVGFGEPLLNKNLDRMILYCSKNKQKVSTVTNAQLLTGKMSKKLLESGLSSIGISIDGATKETYEKARDGASFKKLMQNVKRFVKTKNRLSPSTKTYLLFVLTKNNAKELSKIVRLAKTLKLNGVMAQHIQFTGGYPKTNLSESILFSTEKKQLQEEIKKSRKLAKRYCLEYSIQGFEKDKRQTCHWLWAGVYITKEGNIAPCCTLPTVSFGNILNKQFNEIWGSKEYVDFRKAHICKNFPEPCKKCNYFYFKNELVTV